jgi:hypothetical protein
MKRTIMVTVLLGSMLGMSGVLHAKNEVPPQAPTSPNYPAWAYAIPTSPPPPRAADDGTLLTLPGSSFKFTASKV